MSKQSGLKHQSVNFPKSTHIKFSAVTTKVWSCPCMRSLKAGLLSAFVFFQNMTKCDTFSYCSFFGIAIK